MKTLSFVLIIFLFIGCGGPAREPIKVLNNQDTTFVAQQPMQLKKSFKKLIEQGDRNKVLNYQKIALDAYQLGYKDISKKFFDKALDEIETVYSNEENARKARSLWYSEGKKDFKGEPYERVMTFYYRGLQYLEDKDYENARASFKSAMLQDAFAEEEQNQCDFSLVVLLDAISSKYNGDIDLYHEALKDVTLLKPDLDIPEEYNTVILLETGNSPRKVSDGLGHSQLKFRRGRKFKEDIALVTIDNNTMEAPVIEDIYWQATSRGGRYFDSLLKGKANFKKVSGELAESLGKISSTTTLISSAGIGGDSLGAVGAGLGLISGIALMSSVSSDARADTRYWNNIPNKVHILFATLPPGQHSFRLEFANKDGEVINSLTKYETVTINPTNNIFNFSSRDRISYSYRK